jgi:hypothetical protein
MTPGQGPSIRLAEALAGDTSELCMADPRPKRLLLFIDQSEELFTQARPTDETASCDTQSIRNHDAEGARAAMRHRLARSRQLVERVVHKRDELAGSVPRRRPRH